jgi:hypothetical protein
MFSKAAVLKATIRSNSDVFCHIEADPSFFGGSPFTVRVHSGIVFSLNLPNQALMGLGFRFNLSRPFVDQNVKANGHGLPGGVRRDETRSQLWTVLPICWPSTRKLLENEEGALLATLSENDVPFFFPVT